MTRAEQSPYPAETYEDRRSDPRLPAQGTVRVTCGDREFDAVVVNSSRAGFCIRHWRRDLNVGDEVCMVSASLAKVKVRIAWNWAVGPVTMSGLQLVSRDPGEEGAADALPPRPAPRIRNTVGLAALTLLLLLVTWYVARA